MNKVSLIAVCWIAVVGCRQAREVASTAPTYRGEVSNLLQVRCNHCHSGEDAGAGFATDSYLRAIGCAHDTPGTSALDGEGAALVRVLERADHARVLSEDEATRLRAWVQAGVPLRQQAVHEPGILNPRSPAWHGALAARDQFGPLTRADHEGVCGRCHDGAPVRPQGVRHSAPDAPACTSCHTQPQGVLACGTCHGDGKERAAPPRDPCLFPDTRSDAHRAHLESTLAATPLQCATCHGSRPTALGGSHADGKLDVVFDPVQAGEDARYDAASGECTVRCHNRGGERARPAFMETGPLGCGACHGAPPDDHYAGSCDRCHSGVDASGSKLVDARVHMDGTSGPGDGPAACGACHGQDDDPAPRDSPAHALHRDTQLMAAIACAECHPVPEHVASAGHLDRGTVTSADVRLEGLAAARERQPSYSAGRCNDVACHGAGLPGQPEPRWDWHAQARPQDCARCHGVPPGPPHIQDNRCASPVCHGSEVSAGSEPAITQSGLRLHINGRYDTTASYRD